MTCLPRRAFRTNRPFAGPAGRGRRPIAARLVVLLLLAACAPGCITFDLASVRKVAKIASFGSEELVEVRKTPQNPLAGPLDLLSNQGPQPSQRAKQLLRRYDLDGQFASDPNEALVGLQKSIAGEPTAEKVYVYAELAYVTAKRADMMGRTDEALDLYAASVAHAYYYLFDPAFDGGRNPYDPHFRQSCDLYNSALEGALRIVQQKGKLQPGKTHSVATESQQYDINIVVRGPWHADDFERFEFVSDYELNGLKNHHHTYGLGVPLMAIRRQHPGETPDEKYYPKGLTFPVTAFLRVRPRGTVPGTGDGVRSHFCTLELCDPLAATDIDVAHRSVPLESDLSVPLAYYLNDPLVRTNVLATFALLHADFSNNIRGLYMLEPYDPNKIPVVMVHGLWSSPVTWMEMFNDLRAMPEVRRNYQFWFYLYPTGQPFWVSAFQMRDDLAGARQTLDPRRQSAAFDQMVLVGHSMGGLVARMQTIESGQDFWHIVSDKPLAQLKADEETRQRLAKMLFFHPNPSVKQVITLGTPHRGSNFANSATRWLSHTFFTLPSLLVNTTEQVVRDNPGFFTNTDLLTITTSIDSLAPDSPVFPVMLQARRAPWVTYHNVVGHAPDEGFMAWLGGKVAGEGDGVVPLESARAEDAVSQIEVPAEHTAIHRHPRAILEVRRVLLEHLHQVQTAWANQSDRRLPQASTGSTPRPGIAPAAIGPQIGGMGRPYDAAVGGLQRTSHAAPIIAPPVSYERR
jgi:pimeloyl-ACP methyl ester carboxylesterase